MKPLRLLLLFILSVSSVSPLFAQNENVDDLLRTIGKLPESDTSHIKALVSLSQIYLDKDPERAKDYLIAALRLSERYGFKRGTAQAALGMGKYCIDRRELDSARSYIDRGLAIYGELRWAIGLANAHNFSGIVYCIRGEHARAVQELTVAAHMYEKLGRKDRMADALGNLGVSYHDRGIYDSAAILFERSLRIAEESGNRIAEATHCISLSNAINNDSISTLYLLRAMKLFEEEGNVMGANMALYNLGRMQMRRQDRTVAVKTFRRVVKQSRYLNDHQILAGALCSLGDLYRDAGDETGAIEHYKEALEIAGKTNQVSLTGLLNNSLARLYRNTDDNQRSVEHASAALQAANTTNSRETALDALLNLAQAKEAMGDADAALEHLRQAYMLRDTINSSGSRKHINELLLKYEADKREASIRLLEADRRLKDAELARRALELMQQSQRLALLAKDRDLQHSEAERTHAELELQKKSAENSSRQAVLLAKENQLQGSNLARERLLRNSALGGAAALLLIGWLVVRRIRDQRRSADLRAESNSMRAELAEARAAALEAERERREKEAQRELTRRLIEAQERTHQHIAADLHDGLGQGLLVIKNAASMALHNGPLPDNARFQIEAVSEAADVTLGDLRHIVRELRPAQFDRFGVSETLRSMLQQLSESTDVHFTGTVDDVDSCFKGSGDINAFRIVQEAVNNIVKHSGAKEAAVRVLKTDGGVRIEVEDDGKGFDPSLFQSPESGQGGFGLEGMAERVRILNGHMDLDSAPGRGTRLSVFLPQG